MDRRPAAGGRRRPRRQDHHLRGLARYPRLQCAFRHATQSGGARLPPGRVLLWLGLGGCGRAVRCGVGDGFRRLRAGAGQPLRPLRIAADAWAHPLRRRLRTGAELRYRRLVRPRCHHLRPRCRGAAAGGAAGAGPARAAGGGGCLRLGRPGGGRGAGFRRRAARRAARRDAKHFDRRSGRARHLGQPARHPAAGGILCDLPALAGGGQSALRLQRRPQPGARRADHAGSGRGGPHRPSPCGGPRPCAAGRRRHPLHADDALHRAAARPAAAGAGRAVEPDRRADHLRRAGRAAAIEPAARPGRGQAVRALDPRLARTGCAAGGDRPRVGAGRIQARRAACGSRRRMRR